MRAFLIGDFDYNIREALEVEGFDFTVAENPYDAAEQVRSNRFDLIVLDLDFLPSGLTLLRQWRHSDVDAHVLVLTSRSAKAETIRALNSGADAAMPKPIVFEELAARMRALMRRRIPVQDHVLRVLDLELNTSSRTVKRAGRTIRLTRREYAMLHILVSQRGRPVSRAMIWRQINPGSPVANSNVIAVYIRYLRVKIDDGFALPLILTVRGKGYMIRGEQQSKGHRPHVFDAADVFEPKLEAAI